MIVKIIFCTKLFPFMVPIIAAQLQILREISRSSTKLFRETQ